MRAAKTTAPALAARRRAGSCLRLNCRLSPRSWRDYYRACENLVELLGRHRLVTSLAPDDFSKLRFKLAQTRGPVALANEIQRVRTVFKFGYDEGLIDRPIRYGSTFKKPARKAMRQARQAKGPRMFEPQELCRILDAAPCPIKAMVLLGLNCGFGQTDVASLPIAAIDFAKGCLDFPRPKTAIPRRIPLWPETLTALQDALALRTTPKVAQDNDLLFVTKFGRPWVRIRLHESGKAVHIDSVRLEYNKLLVRLGLKRNGSFYNLRHIFRTVADGCRDQVAIDTIMGHVREGDMANFYRERIEDHRLTAVVCTVRNWLWPQAPADSTPCPLIGAAALGLQSNKHWSYNRLGATKGIACSQEPR
jgi:integrase